MLEKKEHQQVLTCVRMHKKGLKYLKFSNIYDLPLWFKSNDFEPAKMFSARIYMSKPASEWFGSSTVKTPFDRNVRPILAIVFAILLC